MDGWVSMLRAVLLSLVLLVASGAAVAADIYGYIDERGVAHFASEKVDERYQLFFRGGQSFDTADGIAPLGKTGRNLVSPNAKAPAASQTLLALFEASPHYKTAKTALRDAARRHAIDYELLQALIATESGFDAQAVSPKGALGLMQLMPATAARYGVVGDRRTPIEKKLFDPRINVAAGSRHLRDLIQAYPGQLELALAAYNAGAGAVERAGNRVPNYRETQNYVRTVLQLYAFLKPAVAGPQGGQPGRIRMELMPRGGAIGRGNLPPAMAPELPSMKPEPAEGDAIGAPSLRLDSTLRPRAR
ncbi:Lytic transglycosylase [Burkholderiales bacterium 8X]|nr:Lytic transglycosylase [Burkholderiales bacterium 8X]